MGECTEEVCGPEKVKGRVCTDKRTRSIFGKAECVLHTHLWDKKIYWKCVHTLAYMLVSAKKKCAQVLLERDECALSFVLRSTYVPLARRRRWVAH